MHTFIIASSVRTLHSAVTWVAIESTLNPATLLMKNDVTSCQKVICIFSLAHVVQTVVVSLENLGPCGTELSTLSAYSSFILIKLGWSVILPKIGWSVILPKIIWMVIHESGSAVSAHVKVVDCLISIFNCLVYMVHGLLILSINCLVNFLLLLGFLNLKSLSLALFLKYVNSLYLSRN